MKYLKKKLLKKCGKNYVKVGVGQIKMTKIFYPFFLYQGSLDHVKVGPTPVLELHNL